jgi:hypothetical protein
VFQALGEYGHVSCILGVIAVAEVRTHANR